MLRDRRAERRTYLHLRKSFHPSADELICNSISHNVISLAFTHLADKGKQARRPMKYRFGLKEDLNGICPLTPPHTHTQTHTQRHSLSHTHQLKVDAF